jgi:hypothetical protein
MPYFHLTIKEHEEYGGNGIYFNMGREYFQPAMGGLQVAHDILEHPINPHDDGYIDEFMALGGVIAGRVENQWTSQYGRILRIEDLSSDISSLAFSALMNGGSFCPETNRTHLRDQILMNKIRKFVFKGLIEAVNEYEDKEYEEIPTEYDFDIDSIVGWICRGYQLFNKRFSDTYETSIYLFNKIAKVCDDWYKKSEEGDTAKLYVNFSRFTVELIENDWE